MTEEIVTITAEDVEAAVYIRYRMDAGYPGYQGRYTVDTCCPVYQALRRLGYPVAHVSYAFWADTEGKQHRLPDELRAVTWLPRQEWGRIKTPISVRVAWDAAKAIPEASSAASSAASSEGGARAARAERATEDSNT